MKITPQAIQDVLLLEPPVFQDPRGFLLESFHLARLEAAVGRPLSFVQDNHSRSLRGVLRGLHYQLRQPQGKLVRVTRGEVFDVAVDLRRNSPTFGRWTGCILTETLHQQLWIPEGFAHGFLVLSESADVLYKTTAYWAPTDENCILWNDAELAIAWPATDAIRLSDKDAHGLPFRSAPHYA